MKKRRLKSFCGRLAAVAFLGSAITCAGAYAQETSSGSEGARNVITFTSWTGPYMRSQMLGFVRPYEEKTGVRVNVAHYAGGIGEIRDQVESANVIWDVVDLTQADSLRACNEGLLESLEGIDLPDGTDGAAFQDDFVDGALNDCGVGVIVWATAFAYSNEASGDTPPTTIADFFDTKIYPGPRAIRNDPTVVMEWALIADGVAPEDVYSVLETPEGIERALAKMDAIKPGLKLWDSGREPVRLLNSGEVAMSMIGRQPAPLPRVKRAPIFPWYGMAGSSSLTFSAFQKAAATRKKRLISFALQAARNPWPLWLAICPTGQRGNPL